MTPGKISRCVLYARISVTKEESVSIERQLQSCRKYAEARGWDILGEFADDGVSATQNRPEARAGWRAVLATPGFQAVVIWKVDRLARKVLDFLNVDQALQQRGAGLVAVEDPIDMTTPQGRAFATMLAVFGEMEAAAISARITAARAHLARNGRWPGGGVPYGYQPVRNPDGPGRVLAKDPDRIGWLARIAEMALSGEPVNKIARSLTERGAPPPRQSKPPPSGRYPWMRQTVVGLLRNPILAGMRPHNPGRGRSGSVCDPFSVVRDDAGNPLVDESLAIITVEQFARLQQFVTINAGAGRKRGERVNTSALLSRVACCEQCGCFMHRTAVGGAPALHCASCGQTITRAGLEALLERRLLAERGEQPLGGSLVRIRWAGAEGDDDARRSVLVSQIDTLAIRRAPSRGGRLNPARVSIRWRGPAGADETPPEPPPPEPTPAPPPPDPPPEPPPPPKASPPAADTRKKGLLAAWRRRRPA